MSVAAISAMAQESIVVVETQRSRGAGFLVSDHLIVTSLHVVEGESRIVLRTRQGITYPVLGVLAYSDIDDVAVLATMSMRARPLKLGDSDALNSGDSVVAIGHPQGLEATVSSGIVSGMRENSRGMKLLQITAPISPGSSGGPVLNDRGEVVGVTRMMLTEGQALNFATPGSRVKALLAAAGSAIPIERFAELTRPVEQQQVSQARPQEPVKAALPYFIHNPEKPAMQSDGFPLGVYLPGRTTVYFGESLKSALGKCPELTAHKSDGSLWLCPGTVPVWLWADGGVVNGASYTVSIPVFESIRDIMLRNVGIAARGEWPDGSERFQVCWTQDNRPVGCYALVAADANGTKPLLAVLRKDL